MRTPAVSIPFSPPASTRRDTTHYPGAVQARPCSAACGPCPGRPPAPSAPWAGASFLGSPSVITSVLFEFHIISMSADVQVGQYEQAEQHEYRQHPFPTVHRKHIQLHHGAHDLLLNTHIDPLHQHIAVSRHRGLHTHHRYAHRGFRCIA